MNQRQRRWHDGTMAADGHRLADGRWQALPGLLSNSNRIIFLFSF